MIYIAVIIHDRIKLNVILNAIFKYVLFKIYLMLNEVCIISIQLITWPRLLSLLHTKAKQW